MQSKLNFLQNEFTNILASIPENRHAVFGKMNLHQMVEHMVWSIQIANGKLHFKNHQSAELTEKMYRFLMSEKQFRDNTPNSNLGPEPMPTITENVVEAIENLQSEINGFVKRFEEEEGLRIENPFFGMLNFEEQVQLLYKHAMHHLRQFDALAPTS